MDEAKIYNVCLQRVKFQVAKAKERLKNGVPPSGRLILESYNTGDMEEIIDILEIYDLQERTCEGLTEKLADLALTVSVLVREKIAFDYDEKGNLGLFLLAEDPAEEAFAGTAAAASANW